MIIEKQFYRAPYLHEVAVSMEYGFAPSGGFEQPDYGGEDNL